MSYENLFLKQTILIEEILRRSINNLTLFVGSQNYIVQVNKIVRHIFIIIINM